MQHLLYRSYSLSDYLKATASRDPKKLTDFRSAATKMLFVEEIYDARGSNNHTVDGWSYEPRTNSLWDPLGVFHSDACTFSYMDGHSARKKWADKRTVIFFTSRDQAASMGFGRKTPFNPPNEDLVWLDAHYPGRHRYAP